MIFTCSNSIGFVRIVQLLFGGRLWRVCGRLELRGDLPYN